MNPFWRDPHSFGYYNKKLESTVWQAICPTCMAEFAEGHICPVQKRIKELEQKRREINEELWQLQKPPDEDEDDEEGEGSLVPVVVPGPIIPMGEKKDERD